MTSTTAPTEFPALTEAMRVALLSNLGPGGFALAGYIDGAYAAMVEAAGGTISAVAEDAQEEDAGLRANGERYNCDVKVAMAMARANDNGGSDGWMAACPITRAALLAQAAAARRALHALGDEKALRAAEVQPQVGVELANEPFAYIATSDLRYFEPELRMGQLSCALYAAHKYGAGRTRTALYLAKAPADAVTNTPKAPV